MYMVKHEAEEKEKKEEMRTQLQQQKGGQQITNGEWTDLDKFSVNLRTESKI